MPPTLAGAAAASLALVAAAVALRRLAPGEGAGRGRQRQRLRGACAAFLLAYAVNSIFGLDGLAAAISRCSLLGAGAYGGHGGVQFLMAVVLLTAAALGAVAFRRHYAPELREAGIALGVVGALGLFLSVRALSLHQIDAVLNFRLAGVSVNRAVELGLLALFIAASIRKPGFR